jgi:class 3 adenylate cyclase
MAVSRRTVTILFADVAGSTQLGERLDPEALRGVITGWFDDARAVIERHGGTVEKFIGDAVMGVFGVPSAHEDDALRAVRAALELREHASGPRDGGEQLRIRVGINTGEVVAGDPSAGHAFVSGDAVNTAKRLEEAARSAEILIGGQTEQLVRGIALLEPADPIVAKGKAAPVAAWRVLAAIPGLPAIARRTDTPLVGRVDDLARVRRAYERSVSERTCVLFTLLGPAGIGKSRLVSELLDDVRDDATVLVGRCLAYGDGISFWPIYEMLRDLGGSSGVEALIPDEEERDLVVQRLAGATARGRAPGTQETYWAFRKVCEALARDRPLILCFEDVHWAEPTMLDLVEYLAGWIRDSPILVLCVARPEFLDTRPSWLGGGGAEASLTLAPLSHADSLQLLDGLGSAGDAQQRIAEAADGNPLYAEQMAAMVAEGADKEALFTFPPTIQALLAARLDRLPPQERTVIERAAVAGREFWRDAILALTPDEERGAADSSLMALVRKELVRPHRSNVRTDDAFRFSHALIRDAAYAGIPKETRATLHERFAEWVAVNAGDRAVELEEIIGYHLEQAYLYREQLFRTDDETRRIANRAGELLGSAGHRAFARGDVPAAVNLLARATALLDEDHPIRAQALPELGSALMRAGDFDRADEVLSESLARAAAAGDKRLELRTLIEREFFRAFTNPESSTEEIVRVAEHAIPLLEELGDEFGLAKAWWLRSEADVIAGRWGARADALERALTHARRAGSRESLTIVAFLAQALEYGPTPVPEAIRRCTTLRSESQGDRAVDAAIMSTLASLTAMEGGFDEARRLYADSNALHEELGLNYLRAGRCLVGATIESLAGNMDAAVAELQRGYDALEQMGERGTRSTVAAFLAHALAEQARFAEADEYALISEQTGALADIVTQAVWRSARALVAAHAGDDERAEKLGREAVELAERTDFLDLHARTALTLATLLRSRGSAGEAAALVVDARRAYERKGNRIAVQRLAAHAEAR